MHLSLNPEIELHWYNRIIQILLINQRLAPALKANRKNKVFCWGFPAYKTSTHSIQHKN
jgi:hypothetical protein